MEKRAPIKTRIVTPPDLPGTLLRYPNFHSNNVVPRNVDVWLPPDFSASPTRRLPVLYMHDGQNLFDPALSFSGVSWGVSETLTRLAEQGRVRSSIIVGIWNTERRIPEYLPAKPFLNAQAENMMRHSRISGDPILSDEYLRFIVRELKPFVDREYPTLSDRANTFTMGSSLGGLISLYALCEYPDIFGGAGCVSTAWTIGGGTMLDYLQTSLPPPGAHKLYFDFGTGQGDKWYEPFQKHADDIMRTAGYAEGKDWVSHRIEGADHSERAWRERVDLPLEFLLRPQ